MKRVIYKDFAGLRINGDIPIGPLDSPYHIDKAEWITAVVESGGEFGTVISYDGTGITAGIHQCIAVFPRGLKQGTLWKMLNRMRSVSALLAPWRRLERALGQAGWRLDNAGVLRYIKTGLPVGGKALRAQLTGNKDGLMPARGPHRADAEKWADLFNDLFTHPTTFKVQRDYGLEHFIKRADRVKMRYCNSVLARQNTIQEAIYGQRHMSALTDEMTPEFDLAMAMFWSNTVNAPGAALRKLCQAADMLGREYGDFSEERQVKFAKRLVNKLGNTTFGRWDDDIPGGRYQRTRRAATKVYPRRLFVGPQAIMPKDLVG